MISVFCGEKAHFFIHYPYEYFLKPKTFNYDIKEKTAMSIDYNVTQDGFRIDTFPKGMLDITVTVDYFSRIKNDERIKQGAIEVVNFEHVTDFKISYVESEKLPKVIRNRKAPV